MLRAGYGINYTVAQYGNFIQNLAYQPPFANVQINRPRTPRVFHRASQCGTLAELTATIVGNYAINPNYRLPYVQVWNLDIQRNPAAGHRPQRRLQRLQRDQPRHRQRARPANLHTDFASGVFSTLRIRSRSPNSTRWSCAPTNACKMALPCRPTYTYSHSIDNASSIGAGVLGRRPELAEPRSPKKATPASTSAIRSTATSSTNFPSAPESTF